VNRALLPLRLGDTWFGVDALAAREVLGACTWMPVPGAPDFLPGVVAWRGRAIAVLDLSGLFGASPLAPGEARERTVVMEADGCTMAVYADAVREVAEVPEDQVRPLHAASGRFCVAEVDVPGATLAILDLASVVAAVVPKGAA